VVTVEDFSRLVSGIYAAAVTPEDWEPAIRDIRRALGATSGVLMAADEPIWSIEGSALRGDAVESYEQYYCHLDYVLADVKEGPVAAVRTGTELVLPRRNTEFYTDWLHPNELADGLFFRLTGGPTPSCFTVAGPKQTEPFDTPERVKVMSSLVVHLQQAIRIQQRMGALANRSVELVGALNAVRHGIMLVGSDCCVLDVNTAAEAILRAGDGVHVHAGRIGATNTITERALYRALHAALLGESSGIRHSRSLICERPSGKRPYVIHVHPLHRSGSDEMSRDAIAIVLIVDPEQEPEPAAELLRRLFGLTRSEAEVAVRIARGADVKAIAEDLSISLATVRTHLRHVFDKTDTHRQSELVRHLVTFST
jgi:DNA-binding CsgD family transcriptional regulator